mmetsp:Transcript_62055/g.183355  ORF Transcript_62055/g.183355 Transcript_62055/m.183355 type:complete len:267 (+) Transcript_62055:1015-1815(+)
MQARPKEVPPSDLEGSLSGMGRYVHRRLFPLRSGGVRQGRRRHGAVDDASGRPEGPPRRGLPLEAVAHSRERVQVQEGVRRLQLERGPGRSPLHDRLLSRDRAEARRFVRVQRRYRSVRLVRGHPDGDIPRRLPRTRRRRISSVVLQSHRRPPVRPRGKVPHVRSGFVDFIDGGAVRRRGGELRARSVVPDGARIGTYGAAVPSSGGAAHAGEVVEEGGTAESAIAQERDAGGDGGEGIFEGYGRVDGEGKGTAVRRRGGRGGGGG